MIRAVEWRDLRLPLLAWAVVALVSIFLHGPVPLYSTRSLAVAWEMWDRGSWLVPLFNGAPYSHKTPLLPWLIHAGWLVGGVNDVWPRLLMVLLGGIVVAQTGVLARRLYPQRAGIAANAAWAMAGFWYFFLFALQVMYELPLAVAVLGGLIALCRRDGEAWRPWWPGVALAIGVGLLAKGPVALLHLGVPMLAARWWHPAARADGRRFAKSALLALLGGIALFALWLVPALLLGDPEYREALLVTQTAGRIKDSFDHAEPWWWYAPTLLVLMAPWWWQAWWWRQVPALWRDPGNRFAWIWALGMVFCFSLISGKQPYYLLPGFAAFALLLAVAADARPRLGVMPGIAVAMLALVLLAFPLYAGRIALPYPAQLRWSFPVAGGAMLLVALAMLRWRHLPLLAGGVLVAAALLHAGATPLIRDQFDFTQTAHALAKAQREGARVAFLGEYQLQFHFAGRLHDPLEVVDEAAARDWAMRHPRDVIVVNTRDRWTHAGAQPIVQQRFRKRWIQVWRAGEWRALPAQQIPLGPAAGELRYQPR
ncbi:ArnT family glycosyltransferase [Thermomonas sp.]|uniref:ArnT family glycosyltransferase n=1 Tax=Thermomonas sp. TaxID=1971895 RepID=UPI0035B0F640